MKVDHKAILKIALYVVSTITLLNGVSTLQEKKIPHKTANQQSFVYKSTWILASLECFFSLGGGWGKQIPILSSLSIKSSKFKSEIVNFYPTSSDNELIVFFYLDHSHSIFGLRSRIARRIRFRWFDFAFL